MVCLVKKIRRSKAKNTDWIKLRNFWAKDYIPWITKDSDFKCAFNFIKGSRRKSDCDNLNRIDDVPLDSPWGRDIHGNLIAIMKDIAYRKALFLLNSDRSFILPLGSKRRIFDWLTKTLITRRDFIRTRALLSIRLHGLGLPKKDC